MNMQFKLPIGLVLWLGLGVLGGALVAAGFYFNLLAPSSTKGWMQIGGAFWVLTGFIIWAVRSKIEIGFASEDHVRPELSNQQWKEVHDRAQNWPPFKHR